MPLCRAHALLCEQMDWKTICPHILLAYTVIACSDTQSCPAWHCCMFRCTCLLFICRFFCDCGAGALSCDCLLTGYKAFSSPKVSKLQQHHGNQSQPSVPTQQHNTSTSWVTWPPQQITWPPAYLYSHIVHSRSITSRQTGLHLLVVPTSCCVYHRLQELHD